MKFTPKVCDEVEKEILAALKSVEAKYGITIKREGGGRYTENDFTFKIKCQSVGQDGENIAEKAAFERGAVLFGFKPEHYGKVFTSPNGGQYRLVGFNYRARRMPIQAQRVGDNAPFKFPNTMKDHILRTLA